MYIIYNNLLIPNKEGRPARSICPNAFSFFPSDVNFYFLGDVTSDSKFVVAVTYVHFLWTMDGPDSSYSSFLIHISSKVDREDRIDPPIQTEYFLSGGAIILMFMLAGAWASISFFIRSSIWENIVDPPDMTMLLYRSLRISTSHFIMELKVNTWI